MTQQIEILANTARRGHAMVTPAMPTYRYHFLFSLSRIDGYDYFGTPRGSVPSRCLYTGPEDIALLRKLYSRARYRASEFLAPPQKHVYLLS